MKLQKDPRERQWRVVRGDWGGRRRGSRGRAACAGGVHVALAVLLLLVQVCVCAFARADRTWTKCLLQRTNARGCG